MRRREFIGWIGGAATWPLAARAQQRVLPVVGFVNVGARSDADLVVSGFRRGLGEGGLVESRNVAIEYRWADNQIDRVPELVADLVQRRVAVIVAAPNQNSIVPAKAATSTIPIVFMSGPDPVSLGLVASLNRPGGNLTGVTLLSPETDHETARPPARFGTAGSNSRSVIARFARSSQHLADFCFE